MSSHAEEEDAELHHSPRRTWLVVAFAVTLAAGSAPGFQTIIWHHHLGGEEAISFEVLHDLVLLALGLVLALSAPSLCGLKIGSIRSHWRRVLLVCGLPIGIAAVVYPNLPERPFSESGWSMWAISPLGQELIFTGFLYGHLLRIFPGVAHRRLPVNRALIMAGSFFALWHLPNVALGMSGGFAAFQLCYTFLGFVIVGLSRQWTGSLLYAAITHIAINAIAWAAG